MVIQPQYDITAKFSDGLAAVKNDGKWGYIDRAGKMIILLGFDNAESSSDGLASVQVSGRWGYIDHDGKSVWAAPPK